MIVFQITEKDILGTLDTLADDYHIARALMPGDTKTVCMYVKARLDEVIAIELDDICKIFLEETEDQRRRDNRRLW